MAIFTLGPEGTYSSQIALQYFADSTIKYLDSISEVFEMVNKKRNAYGIIPLENMIEGSVRETLDLLYETDLKIIDIINLPIHHCLCAQSNDFEIITSHPQALAQCKKYLNKNYKKKLTQSSKSTAQAALQAAEYSQYAAISSKFAAEKYNLQILAENIEDFHGNVTKFAVIGKQFSANYQNTSIALTPTNSDEPGLLIKMLYPFQENNINLTKLESRPQKDQLNNYIFFIDFEGDPKQAKVRKTFTYLEKDLGICTIKVLGGKANA